MIVPKERLRERVLDLVRATDGGISIGALVNALPQHEGGVIREIWSVLDQLTAEGSIRLEGSLTQRRAVAVNSAPATMHTPATVVAEPRQNQGRSPSLQPAVPEPQAAPPPSRTRGKRTTRYRNLTRVDDPDHHMVGYMGRIQWRSQRYQAFFSDHIYGDGLGALTAALEWRSATERAIGKPATPDPPANLAGKSKYTGMYGVSRINRRHSPYFIATWYERGKRKTACFALAKYGEREALRLAREAYERGSSAATPPADNSLAALQEYDGT
ncbi:MAG: AP2 domain-containing protein [Oscillochloris sp.]|nr:AP2 domain-containing protein [Oscillochloris sp.]